MSTHRFALPAALIVALVAAACARIDVSPASVPSLKEGRSVEIGRDAAATVGSVIYSEFSYYSAQGAVTRAPYSRDILAARVVVPAGMPLIEASVDGATAYCTARPAFFPLLDPPRSICFFDSQRTGTFTEFYVAGTLSTLRYEASVPYQRMEASSDSTGFKYELLYQGIAGDVVKIAYREYSNNFVRPAYQQDLSYTLRRGGPTEISFRGVQILIYAADNNQIRYRVLSGFAAAR